MGENGMKHLEFIKALVSYYGEYSSKLVERMTFEYLQDRFNESELESVFKTIIVKVNPKFKTPPSPADFEEFFPRVNLTVEANEWYDKINRTGTSLDNIIISNKRAELALEAVGGWIAFTQRNPEYEGLHRKQFVEAYLKAQNTGEQPKLIYGESSRKYEKPALIIGDKEKCLEIINQGNYKQIDTDIFKKIDLNEI